MEANVTKRDLRNEIKLWLNNNRDEVVDLTLRLVQIKSQQPEGDVRAMADEIETIAATIPGVEVERIVSEEPVHNLVIRLRGNRPGKRLIFNGHMDTFPVGDLSGWTRDPEGEVDGDRAYGLGISDMKGGIAASLLAMKCLAETGADFPGEIVGTFVGDEETMGVLGTQYLLENVSHARGDAMISGDVGSPHILRFGEKGMIWAKVTAKGRSTHAAHVHKGDSAIEKLTAVMESFKSLRSFPVDTAGNNVVPMIDHWSEKSERLSGEGETKVLKSVSVTFGTIGGGRLSNLVADRAEFSCDIRLPVGVTVDQVETEMTRICDAAEDLELEITRRYEPSWTAPDHPVIEAVRQNCTTVLGEEPAVTMRVGASDARLYRYAGVPTVVCGLMAFNLGAPDEHIMLDELYALVDIFALSAHDYLVGDA
ncbi:M20/M25/M40 family metallo-hydrolase [uncultured Roseovarius sp.]|uniref:M20/M25/M40 family metallo-hydrolase n=1 Tax=uncultured Roseovarius sp. TaxID=293344 RepID=UPI0026047B04|nr:M20/M25/M40 family metallo-hydrolase [uncultured Roseovarius sp.]